MKGDLEQKLYKDFPSLYRQKDWFIKESCMPWGFEFGSGWFQIVYDLSKRIMEIDPGVQASQVKEKFGGLRFYVSNVARETSDAVFEAIDKAEAFSLETCENCGNLGKPNEFGWIVTLCDGCRVKRNESRL